MYRQANVVQEVASLRLLEGLTFGSTANIAAPIW
jgi:hypothetical protein